MVIYYFLIVLAIVLIYYFYFKKKLLLNWKLIKLMFSLFYHCYLLPKWKRKNTDYYVQMGCQDFLEQTGICVWQYGTLDRSPVIYVANHQSFLDGVVLKSIVPSLRGVAKHDASSEYPIFGNMLQEVLLNYGAIFYKRGNKDSGQIVREKMADSILDDKTSVLVFPEGKAHYYKEVQPFYPGSFEISKQFGIRIQPITIKYNYPIGWGKKDENIPKRNYDLRHNLDYICKLPNLRCEMYFHPTVDPTRFESPDELKEYCYQMVASKF